MRQLIKSLFASPANRYFRFGMRYAAKIPSAFARETTVEQAMNYISHCNVAGAYAEFGVWQGRTFSAACYHARELRLKMDFWAFDAFQGLPAAEGHFNAGAYTSSRALFLRNVKKNVGSVEGVHVVEGWFSDTLKNGNPEVKTLGPIAFAWVDCDIYESTVPVLEFLTNRLQDGSVLCFDDWYCLKASPAQGEQKACREWLLRNPDIQLSEYGKISWHGQAFIVHRHNGVPKNSLCS